MRISHLLNRLNPFKDNQRITRSEIRQSNLEGPFAPGDRFSDQPVEGMISGLTYREYNDAFEDDCFIWDTPGSGHVGSNFRDKAFNSSGSEASHFEVSADKGVLGTAFLEKRSHVHFNLGTGDDTAVYEGNSQRNIAVVEAGHGRKDVRLELGAGDDKAVLFLDGAQGTIFVDGGEGSDTLEVVSRGSNTDFEVVSLAESETQSDSVVARSGQGDKLRILTRGINSYITPSR